MNHRQVSTLARLTRLVHAGVGLCVCASAVEAAAGLEPVSFSKEIAPILLQKCVVCHGPEKAKGGLRLDSFEALRAGGKSKEPTVTAGRPDQSKLYQLLVAKDPEDRMPQKDDPLPAAQVALIERWIQGGASFDGPDPKAPLISLLPPANHPAPPASYPRPVPIPALAFSPDGHTLAAAGYHEITLWNPEDATLLRRVTNVAQQTLSLAFSPDGSWLAAGSGNPGRSGEARLFSPASGALVRTFVTISDLVLAVVFSPDGQTLAVGGADNIIRLFDVQTGREQRRIEQHADWVMGLAFSPDGTRLASASRDKSARLFDLKTGELEETYTGHAQPIFAVAFGMDGKLVFTGGRDKAIHAWQVKEAKRSYEIPGFESDVWRLVVQSNRLFTCSADREVREYKISDQRAEKVRTLKGHRDVVYALAHHDATDRLASAGYDGEVRIWDVGDGTLLRAFLAAPGYQADNVAALPAGPAAEPTVKKPKGVMPKRLR